MTDTPIRRWEALDMLRGLSIVGMLINLTGAWDHEYTWIQHAKWEGGHLIDMVAPVFLFCIGAAIPLSLQSRANKGADRGRLTIHILVRCLALVALGLFLNAYPTFDLVHVRIPGVPQKLGLSFALAGLFMLWTARRDEEGLVFSWKAAAGAIAVILVAHWALLEFVPVPGFGAHRFDPVGSWPSFIDRSLFTVPHMFIYWPVDGKVVFDPDGLLNVTTSTANVLFGVLAALAWQRSWFRRPVVVNVFAGVALMAIALLLNGICPIIKNIWTSTFVLFSTGFALVVLALLTVLTGTLKAGAVLFPLKIYGANPLLAYIIFFVLSPVLNLLWIPTSEHGKVSVMWGGQILAGHVFDPYLSSLFVSLIYLSILFLVLLVCYRKRWFLKL